MRWMICKFFFHSLHWLFTFLIVSFEAQIFLFQWSPVNIPSLVACIFHVMSKISSHNSKSQKFACMFSPKNFVFLALKFRSLVDLSLIFVHGVKWRFHFILLAVDIQLFQHHLLKKLFFLHWMILQPLSKIN